MKYLLLIIITGLFALGCSDAVRTNYATLEEATKAGAFARGWLPPVLPEGSTNIVEVNNLDLNRGHGSFQFSPSTLDKYKKALQQQVNARIEETTGTLRAVIRKENSIWNLWLEEEQGKGAYQIELTK